MKTILSTLSLISLWVVSILTACTSNTSTSSAPIIKIYLEKGRKVVDTVLFEHPKIVVLETNETAYIREINKVACFDSLIYVFDTLQDYVYIFNEQGKFLSRVGRHGQGPGEYADLHDFNIDPIRKELIFSTPRRLQFYSLHGEFLEEVSLPHYVNEFAITGNKVIAREFAGGYAVYEFTFDGHKLIKTTAVDIPPIEYNNFMSSEGSLMTVYNDTVFYTRRFDPTVYVIYDAKATPYITFDFGPYKVTDENKLPMERAASRIFEIASMPNNIHFRDSHMLLNVFPFGLCVYDRTNGKAIQYGSVKHSQLITAKDARLYIIYNQMTASWSEDPSMVVFSKDANSVRIIAERAEGLDPALREKLVNLDDEANPVLFFYRMR